MIHRKNNLSAKSSMKPSGWLEQRFHLVERNSPLATEFRVGVATFMVMAYIIFINPSILRMVADGQGARLSPRQLV